MNPQQPPTDAVDASSGTDTSPGVSPDSTPGLSVDTTLEAPRSLSRWRRPAAALAVLVVAVLVAALVILSTGRGSGSNDGVATLKSPGVGPSAAPSGTANSQDPYQAMLAYSACMRSHGVPDFPDPNSNGGLEIQGGGQNSDLDPNSPTFQAAQQACQSLMPGSGGGQLTNGQGGSGPGLSIRGSGGSQAAQQQLMAYSQCMRSNGVSDFPDPVFSGGAGSLTLPADIDPNSPTFQAAQKACQSLLAVPSGATQMTTGGGQ